MRGYGVESKGGAVLAVLLLSAACVASRNEPSPSRAAVQVPAARQAAPPHEEPSVFAPGVVSSDREEYRITFTPDGTTAYFGRSDEFFPVARQAWIYETRLVDGRWSPPVVAPFSGRYSDLDPFLSPDGRHLYFSSIRPIDGEPRTDGNTWVVERTVDGWGEPVPLPEGVNSAHDDLYPSVDARGNLYVGSTRPPAPGAPEKWRIWRFERTGSGYLPGEPLGEGVNPAAPDLWSFNPAVTPDGRRLYFTRLDVADPAGTGFGEIHVSELHDGAWQPAVDVGPPVNGELDEFHPSLSPDGRTLYFVRRDPRGTDARGDLYSVPVGALVRAAH